MMKNLCGIFVMSAMLTLACTADAGSITTFSDRSAFNAAAGSTTLENFTSGAHYPIPGGELNSTTSFGSLFAGRIQPGVNYTRPVYPGNYFNIDAGGGFVGGFLDGLYHNAPLTMTYAPAVAAFGFDTSNSFMPEFDLTIGFVGGGTYFSTITNTSFGMQFFGFQSSLADIQSVQIQVTSRGNFDFALDNHSFGGIPAVPLPTASLAGVLGFGLMSVMRRKRQQA